MFGKTVFSIFWIFYSLEKYSTHGDQCISVQGKMYAHIYDHIQCEDNKSIHVERACVDIQPSCEYNKFQTNSFWTDIWDIYCLNSSYCQVDYYKYNKNVKYLNIRFQCKDCIAIKAYRAKRITCPSTSVIKTPNVWLDDENCPAIFPSSHTTMDIHHMCKNVHTCLVKNTRWRTASIYYECEGDITNQNDDITTDSKGDVNYAAIAGGIVGGVILIICIIVAVYLLRRRTSTASGSEQIMTNLNPTYDPSHVQTQQETNQQGHLITSPDNLYVSTSHVINATIVDNTTNEVSNTYSHIRNTRDDSDIMYDHTIRHNIHETCDGDYGIAHRRITEDDYDVSGNYRQSLSKETDPVYN